jgi:hypothetical protein
MLGQPNFAREYVFRPEQIPDKNGVVVEWHSNKTICREWLAQAAAGGAVWDVDALRWLPDPKQAPLTVLVGEEANHIRGIAASLAQNDIVQSGILSGHIERSFFWQDKKTGIWLKSRPDCIPTGSGDYADLKTTTSVHLGDLARSVNDFAYQQQAALVAEGSRICAGIELGTFALVFVEKRPPYCVRTIALREEAIAEGARQNRRALDLIASCLKSGRWPGPGDDHIVYVGLSERYKEEIERNEQQWQQEKAA